MGLFEKKICSICGGKIGFLGNRKLEDGNMCKNCAQKLSPWFSERRHATVEQINQQLKYRTENQKKVEAFNQTRTIGRSSMVYLDEDKGQFLIAQTRDLASENPDVLDYSQVTGCDLDIDETQNEIKRTDSSGNAVSYNPPRYQYSYDFYMVIRVNHPYFDKMRFRLNDSSVEVKERVTNGSLLNTLILNNIGSSLSDVEYREYEEMGNEIKEALTKVREQARENIESEKAPKVAVACKSCGATTLPDENGCCEYCGSPVIG